MGAQAFTHGPQSDTTADYYRAAAWKGVSRKAILEAEAGELRAQLASLAGEYMRGATRLGAQLAGIGGEQYNVG